MPALPFKYVRRSEGDMSMNLTQVKTLVVIPALTTLGNALHALDVPAAIPLLNGTGLAETNYEFLAQFPTGPAVGFWEMECGSPTTTYEDCWTNFLNFPANSALRSAVLALAGANSQPPGSLMCTNMLFACAMARIKYWRSPLPLPAETDAAGMAAYHVAVYNAGGKANAATNTPLFQAAINA
jgi:hypothetical protein